MRAMLAQSALSPARAFAQRFPPAILAPCAPRAPAFAACFRPHRHSRPPLGQPLLNHRLLRNASSASSQSAAIPASSPPSSLPWNDFFALRRTRRRIEQACSGVCAVGMTYYGLIYAIHNGYDSMLSAQFNTDPFIPMGICTLGLFASGWLIGPIFGNQIFTLAYRGVIGDFNRKESAFFVRIKRRRADPSVSSFANPAVDYYGEKISSVAGYRRWLKDQRAFNLKLGNYRAAKIL